jgi:hypothetical protein
MKFQLAQFNIARMKFPYDGPEMRDFVAALDRVNATAESTPGFVWRLRDDGGDASSIRIFDDDRWLVNMSVWEFFDALKSLMAAPGHLAVMRRRGSGLRNSGKLPWCCGGYRPDMARI